MNAKTAFTTSNVRLHPNLITITIPQRARATFQAQAVKYPRVSAVAQVDD